MKRLTILLAFFTMVATGCTSCETDPAVDNLPPTLSLDTQTSLQHTVGNGLVRITVTGEDPEGGPVELGVEGPPSRSDFQLFDGFAIFSWDPIASDITPAGEPLQLVFWVEDDHDVRTEKTVSLEIVPGNGEPRFTSSPSVMHNIDSGKPVRFRVTVRDDDTEQVALAMLGDKAPNGALFTPVPGENAGDFEWEPTADQLKFRVHSVTFEARDGQSPPVQQKVTILFTKGGGGDDDTRPDLPDDPEDPTDCPREDAINHTPLGPQRTTQDFLVEASLSAMAAERYDRVVLNYSTEDLFNDFEAQPDGTEMDLGDDGTYRAYIDNPGLSAGESAIMYYQICAIDDDSTEDDAVLCAPTNIYNSFIVYPPDNTECIDDDAGNDSFDNALSLNELDAQDINWGHYRGCEGTADYYRFEVQPNQFGDIIFTYPFDNDVEIEMFDADQNPLPYEASACSGFANFFPDESEEPVIRYFKVTAPDTPYQISPWLSEPDLMCVTTDSEPNDDSANATAIGTDGDPEPEQEICGPTDVDIFTFQAFEGEQITTTIEFSHAEGDLDMKLYGPDKAGEVDSNGSATRYGLSVDDNETIEHTVQTAGTFYLRVFGYGGDGNTYTLTNLVEEGQTCTDDDDYAGNQARADAAEVEYGSYTGLKVCGGTGDWFTFLPFLPDDWVIVDLSVTTGNLDDVILKLWDGTNELATGMRNGSELSFDYILSGDEGDLYISVEAAADVEYELSLSTII